MGKFLGTFFHLFLNYFSVSAASDGPARRLSADGPDGYRPSDALRAAMGPECSVWASINSRQGRQGGRA